MEWDATMGFRIPYGASTMYSLLTCVTKVNGHEIKSMYIPQRLSESTVILAVTNKNVDISAD